MSDDPTYDFLNAGGQTPVSADPTGDFLKSGGQMPLEHSASDSGTDTPVFQYLHSVASGLGQNLGATGHLVYDWAHGKIHSIAQADQSAKDYKAANPAYQTETEGGKTVSAVMDSNYNPLNWPGLATQGLGKGVTAGLDALGVPSNISTIAGPATSAVADVGMGAYGATKALGLGKATELAAPRVEPTVEPTAGPELSASGSPRPASYEPQDIPGTAVKVDSEPVEGGLPEGASDARAQILSRVGITNARQSALSGDAGAAATDFQLSKFDEPAGQAAKAQFDSERTAMKNHAEGIVKDTGGTTGTDEDTLANRGQTIAAPFDALRDYFDEQHAANYKAADAKAEGSPVGQMEGVAKLLKDPDFTETLLAKDQGGLLGSMQRQFERFQSMHPDGFTAENAENYRKWLNQAWTPENSGTIGNVKGALDDDVLKGAGEDIYGPARALAQTEHQIFGDNGIAKLMDADPRNPLNRSTAYEKIPDTLTRLPAAQFDNVVKTLQTMPEAIQPQAQAAISEIKAHLANKVLDAGSSTQGQWNAPKVSGVLQSNSAKLQSAFEDQPEVLKKFQDLDSAGKILKVNQSYPGAAAQAANALKRGMMSKAISHVSGLAGGAIGGGAGSVLGMPVVGAAVGAGLGEGVGSRIAGSMTEKAALRNWSNRVTKLSDLARTSDSTTP